MGNIIVVNPTTRRLHCWYKLSTLGFYYWLYPQLPPQKIRCSMIFEMIFPYSHLQIDVSIEWFDNVSPHSFQVSHFSIYSWGCYHQESPALCRRLGLPEVCGRGRVFCEFGNFVKLKPQEKNKGGCENHPFFSAGVQQK